MLRSREEVKHLQKHWFGVGPGSSGEWWPSYQPIKRKFREGMTAAFRLSKATGKPIIVYWVVGIEGVFEKILESDAEIIILRFTPMPPGRVAAPGG